MITAMDIRERAPGDVLDYQQLVSYLRDYAKPRDRIGLLMDQGDLIRVRKGLYVLGDRYRRRPLHKGHLANLIYGPSYVSLDYALSHYGLIPERVEEVTSVTLGRRRRFETPLGVFSYRPLPLARYAPGVTLLGEGDVHYLIATAEKALVDKVWADKRLGPASLKEVEAYLEEDLRLDEDRVADLDLERLDAIREAFASRKIDLLTRTLARLKGHAG